MPHPPPIVQGTPTNGAFSEVGALIVDYGNASHLICTGTLVTEDVVLTAEGIVHSKSMHTYMMKNQYTSS